MCVCGKIVSKILSCSEDPARALVKRAQRMLTIITYIHTQVLQERVREISRLQGAARNATGRP